MPTKSTPSTVQRHRLHLLGALASVGGLGLVACSSPPTASTSTAASGNAPSTAPATNPTVMKSANERPFTGGTVTGSYSRRPEVMAQVPEMAKRLQLPEEYVHYAIGNGNFLTQVPRLVLPSKAGSGRRNWRVYRSRFIDNVRIQAGVQFWRENAEALARAERTYGVPAKYIVGIVGVETIYGRNTGNLRVIDTLATLAFDFPQEHPRAQQRNAFFRGELESYLQLTWNNNDDPLSLRGSYAGAMGLPQFMPSSWQKHAVDFDGDGHIDLFASPTDVVGSVAHYFQQYGWVPGLEPEFEVTFDQSRLQLPTLLEPDIRTTFTKEQFAALGAIAHNVPASFNGKLALIELENGNAPSTYFAGTDNFYVITRYNNSSYYAQSVIDLANEVARAMGRR